MKAQGNYERGCARTTKAKYERECARIVNELENDPKALALVVRIAEKFAERSPIPRR